MSGRLVVLDAAGTLVEVRGSIGAVYAALARAAGADLDTAAVERGFAWAFQAAPPLAFGGLDEAARPAAERGWWREVARRALEAAGPLPTGFVFEVFFERAWSWFGAPEAWHVPADVRPGLRALRRAGCPLAVFSNWDGRLEPLLDRLGLAGYFARVLFSGGLPAAKPDPAAFHAARAALAEWAKDAPPIMVGDRIDHDIVPALEAGWGAVWLDRGGRGERPPVGAARVIGLPEVALL
ncbi:MAG: HAD-IA family hydrolase [Gemmatimonadetes bacterium]|nr:HAD-IA family hydrolase [Gemmatimonadota bacterium]